MAMVKDDILDLTLRKVPMFKALVLYVLGVLLAVVCKACLPPLFSIVLLSFLMLVYVLLSYFNKVKQKILFPICFSLVAVFYGYYNYAIKQKQHIENYYTQFSALQYVGTIDDEPVYKEKTVRFPVKLRWAIDSLTSRAIEGRIMMTILRDSVAVEEYKYGDELAFINKLKLVNPPYNPKEFDYKSYLLNKGIEEQCLLQSDEVQILGGGFGHPIIAYSLAVRTTLISKFRKYIDDDEAFHVAVALIFGYRSQIDQNTISAFTDTGTIHVLSVSGLHVSLVFALLNFLLFWMDRFRYGKFIKSIIVLVAIWAYVILTGMSPPILRAGIMISFFVSSILINRKQIPLNTLAASALFILLFSPNYLFDEIGRAHV